MNIISTIIDNTIQSLTSDFVSVSIESEPNSVEHTSPDRFDEVEKMFIKRYPKASAPTEIMAIAASPFTFVFAPVRSSNIALTIVTGSTIIVSFVKLSTAAMAIAPKATCERPSPMKEKRLSTKVTPRSDEQSAIRMPTIKAYLTIGYCMYKESLSICLFLRPDRLGEISAKFTV